MEIRELALSEMQEVSKLMGRVFQKFDAVDCEERGICAFLESVDAENLKVMVREDELRFYGVFEEEGDLVGVLGARRNYLAFLFIHEDHMGCGHGRRLLSYYLDRLRESEECYESVQVNSSSVARAFYARQGFVDKGERIVIFGIPYYPMERSL